MRRGTTDSHWTDLHHYDCPYCEKGEAVFFGFDTRKERVFECNDCARKLGEFALEHAARERSLAQLNRLGRKSE
jgi:transposase-like protein